MANEQIDAEIAAEAKAIGLDESDLTGEAAGSFNQPLNHELDPEEDKSSEQQQVQVEEKTDTDEPESDEDEQPPADQSPKNKAAQDAFKQRQGKRRQEIEELTSLVSTQQSQISELTGLVKQALSPKTDLDDKKEAKADYKVKLKEFADKNGIEEEDMEALSGAMVDAIAEKLGISPEKVQEMTQATTFVKKKQAEDQDRQEQQVFEGEWKAVVPDIRKAYPNASEEQLEKAQKLMDELSHNENYGRTKAHPAMPLDYILYKEGKKFQEVLFSPKRITAESGQLGDWQPPQGEPLNFNFETLTPDAARKAEDEIDALYGRKS